MQNHPSERVRRGHQSARCLKRYALLRPAAGARPADSVGAICAYVVGAHLRERHFPGPATARVLVGGQANTFLMLLVDGEVVGVWHQRRELDQQTTRVGEFVEGVAELSMGKSTVGVHV